MLKLALTGPQQALGGLSADARAEGATGIQYGRVLTVAGEISAARLGLRGSSRYELHGVIPPGPRLAIVGSRACHRPLADAVPVLVEAAADCGFSVVSGGALGIDARAHRSALEQSVPQLAVLPLGSDRPYPPRHVSLFERIRRASGSGVLFGRPRGCVPNRAAFASRNRIVVGCSRAVIVVEAGLRSGSTGTGRLALAGGVRLAVLPGSRGCAALGAEGATVLRWDHDPFRLQRLVRAWLDGELLADAERSRWPARLAWLYTAVVEAGPRGLAVDELPAPLEGLIALAEAEAGGLVTQLSPGRYVLS